MRALFVVECSKVAYLHKDSTEMAFNELIEVVIGGRSGFVSRGSSFPCTLAPAHLLIRVAFESRSSGVPLSNSEHLSPADFVDLEDKDLEAVMEGLANQNPNLLAQQIQVSELKFLLMDFAVLQFSHHSLLNMRKILN